MDAEKKTKSSAKKEKVGEDGLSKKERRALKVQSKQTKEDAVSTTNDHKSTVSKAENDKTNVVKPVKPVPKETAPKGQNNSPKATKTDSKNEVNNKQLTDKELRKLEWEKKLAEQIKGETKDNAALSKAELKAKRREQQEAQRQLKTVVKPPPQKPVPINEDKEKKTVPKSSPLKNNASPVKKEIRKASQVHKVQLVQHLYTENSLKSNDNLLAVYKNVHPAFVKLGVQYQTKKILGSNARCLALLAALKRLIYDLQTPPKQEFCRYLESVLKNCADYLQECRPFAVSMTNTLRHFKLQLTQIDTNLKDSEKKTRLQEYIDIYINDDIKKAGDAISLRVNEKISNGDVILTYGCSSLIRKILLDAQKDGKKFEVIIIDGRPLLEGREMLRRLVCAGISCTYVLINAVSFVMGSVSKVLLGAHALLTNGYVMSRTGTAQVALVAQAYNKPVLVCCETYKFSERVQTDSFVHNEIGDPETLVSSHVEKSTILSNWKENSKLTLLNLLYDVTPPDLVTAVVTELAILPCTSVPVVLRINANEVA